MMRFKFYNNFIFLTGYINHDSNMDIIIEKIAWLNYRKIKQIVIILNSVGGDTDSARKLVKEIKKSKSEIITVAFRECHSSASLIFVSGKRRIICKKTDMLIHGPSWGCDYGLSYYFKRKNLDITRQQMIEIYRKNTSISKNLIKQLCRNKDGKIFNAQETIKFGIADIIIDSLKDIKKCLNDF